MTPSTGVPHRIHRLEGPWLLSVDRSGPTPVPAEAAAVPDSGVPGRVPGAVHDDLQRAGIIPDPLVQDHEESVAWVSHTDWVYRTTLSPVAGSERVDLVFDGIDTVSRIALGETELGRTRNMHRRYRFDITGLRDTDLAVHLTSPYTAARGLQDFTGPRPNSYPEPFNFIRKMACSFGWDWGITLPGAGLWQGVHLDTWSTARIAQIRPLTDVDGDTGVLTMAVEIERSDGGRDAELVIEAILDGTTVAEIALPPGVVDATRVIRIADIRRWNPVGYGEAYLYPLELVLRTRAGELLDHQDHRIGFRHIRWHRAADSAGSSFECRVDGKPVLIKGVNWIPVDVMPGRASARRYRELLQRAKDAHVNLIRVWGGGLYETDEFYEICDELGLMVWQDFPFACAAYPEIPELRDEIRAEAQENVARLSRHPSLVLWNGNNECDWLRLVEDWAGQPGGDADWGERYYHEDLPQIVGTVDPSRAYTPSSPWSGHRDLFPNAPGHGTHHSWEVWNRRDYLRYRDDVPRFVAEFGWQAPPAWRTLIDAVSDDPLQTTSPGLLRRQKATGGMEKLTRGLEPHVRPRSDIDAWHYLMQWNQVRAITTGVDHWRAHWPVTSGMILWQLHDLWPVISWSAIDGAGRRKPLYHALKDLYAPRRISIQPSAAGLVLAAMNDTDGPWRGLAVIRRVGDAGFDAARRTLPLEIAPRSVAFTPIPEELSTFGEPASEVLVATYDGLRAWRYDLEPKDSAFVGAPPRLDAKPVPEGLEVTVTATTLLRDFLIQADRMHPLAGADRGFVTLLPGESATITVTCPEPLGPEHLSLPWATAYLDGVMSGGHS